MKWNISPNLDFSPFQGFFEHKILEKSYFGGLLMNKKSGNNYMDPSWPLRKRLPFKARQWLFFQTGKVFLGHPILNQRNGKW